MGKYDSVDRIYFANRERFAELISIGVYHKRFWIRGDELQKDEVVYPSAKGSATSERDILLCMGDARVKYGVEIENYADYSMPRRFLSYETSDYEKQSQELEYHHKMKKDLKGFVERKSKMKAEDYLIPVINMLLYLGTGHWQGHSTMREMMKVPEKYRPMIQDKIINYSFPIMEADYVNPLDFKTDLRQFFQIMQCRESKEKIRKLLEQEEFQNLCTETQRVIAVHLDNQYILKKIMEEETNMCKALNDWAKEERELGKEEGKVEGKAEGARQTLIENIKSIMNNLGFTMEQAMDVLNVREPERDEYARLLQ